MRIFNTRNSRTRSYSVFFLPALASFLLFASGCVSAASSCSGTVQTFTLTMPATISVPRDAAAGTLLTNWTTSTAATNLYSCTASSAAVGIKGQLKSPTFSTFSGLTGTGGQGGASYNVYNTNIAGVGIAAVGSLYVSYSGWSSWNGFTNSWGGPTYSPLSGSYTIGGQVSVALIKTSAQVVSGGQISGVVLQLAPNTSGGVQTGLADSYAITPVAVVPLSCTTPNVVVPLGAHLTSEMGTVGATTKAVGFNVQINNCPAGLKTVYYGISPNTTVVNGTNGVVALDSTSTASGVGIQLLNGGGTPITLTTGGVTWATLGAYSSATGGSYTVPMQARYYQTATTVMPGSANTTMTLYMNYM